MLLPLLWLCLTYFSPKGCWWPVVFGGRNLRVPATLAVAAAVALPLLFTIYMYLYIVKSVCMPRYIAQGVE